MKKFGFGDSLTRTRENLSYGSKEFIDSNVSKQSKVSSRINHFRNILSARNINRMYHTRNKAERRIRSISPKQKMNLTYNNDILNTINWLDNQGELNYTTEGQEL